MAGMNHLTTDELEERLHYDLNKHTEESLPDLLYDLIDEIIENRRRLDALGARRSDECSTQS